MNRTQDKRYKLFVICQFVDYLKRQSWIDSRENFPLPISKCKELLGIFHVIDSKWSVNWEEKFQLPKKCHENADGQKLDS